MSGAHAKIASRITFAGLGLFAIFLFVNIRELYKENFSNKEGSQQRNNCSLMPNTPNHEGELIKNPKYIMSDVHR
jgi:hypothetical protein